MARTQGSHAITTGPRIRAAALSLFAKHGFAAVSMRQIAGEVGVHAGALYNYTSDKQSLLVSLMRAHMDEALATFEALEKPERPTEQLRQFVEFHIAFHLDRADEVFVAYMELRNLTPENFTIIEDLRRAYENKLEGILKAGQAEGQFDVTDTKVTTLAVIAMLTGVTTWYRPEGRLSAPELTELYWDMARKAVGA